VHLLHEGEVVRLAQQRTEESAMSEGRFNLSALAVRERSVTLFLIILVTIAGILSFLGSGVQKIRLSR
jgi:hypothetical protein